MPLLDERAFVEEELGGASECRAGQVRRRRELKNWPPISASVVVPIERVPPRSRRTTIPVAEDPVFSFT